ncbi:hypothetical protein T439DRAFT_328101 [Meredithblackwellia eburnea MCA 4105]
MLSTVRIQSSRFAIRRSFATFTALRSEGRPSGQGQSAFNKRERAEEERYIRDAELEKIKALKKAIEASQKNLEQLKKDHDELEKSIKK